MSDFVWVKLDRDEAEHVADRLVDYRATNPIDEAIVQKCWAALSEPSENQVERVARALHFNNPGWGEWDEMSDEDQAIFRSDARAALAAIDKEGEGE